MTSSNRQHAAQLHRERWGSMYRLLRENDSKALAVGQAARMYDARDRGRDNGPEHVALARELANALDAQRAHYAALSEVSGQLAQAIYREIARYEAGGIHSDLPRVPANPQALN